MGGYRVATRWNQCFYYCRRDGEEYDAHNNVVGQSGAAGFVVKDILTTNLRKEEGVYLTGDAVLLRAG